MSSLTYKHELTLELPDLSGSRYRWRNLCVQVQRTLGGSYRAILVDLEEFRGEGSGQSLAIDDLAFELEHVAAEIRRANGPGCDKHGPTVLPSWWRGTSSSSRATSESRCHPGDKCDNFPACASCGPARL